MEASNETMNRLKIKSVSPAREHSGSLQECSVNNGTNSVETFKRLLVDEQLARTHSALEGRKDLPETITTESRIPILKKGRPNKPGPIKSSFWFLAVSIILTVGALVISDFDWNNHTKAGVAAVQSKDYKSAEHHFKAAVARVEKFQFAGSRLASSLNSLGEVYSLQSKFEESEAAHMLALEIREKLYGDNHLDVALSLINVGQLMEQRERLGDAEVLYKRALSIRERLLGGAHKDVLGVVLKLARLVSYHDPKGAIGWYDRALRILKSTPVPDKEAVEELICASGSLEVSLPEGEPLYRTEIIQLLEKLGPEYARTLALEKDRVFPAFSQRPDRDFESVLSSWRTYFAQAKVSDAGLYDDAHDIKTLFEAQATINGESYSSPHAILVFNRELEFLESCLGKEHPLNTIPLVELARCGELDSKQRIELCRRAISIWKRFITEHRGLWSENFRVEGSFIDQDIADAYSALTELCPDKSDEILSQQLSMWESALGKDSLKIADVIRCNDGSSNFSKLCPQAVRIFETYLSSPSIKSMSSEHLDLINGLFSSWSESTDPVQVYQLQLAMLERALGASNPQVAVTLNELAEIRTLPRTARLDYCRRAINIWRANLKQIPGRSVLANDINWTFQLYEDLTENPVEARSMRIDFWRHAGDEHLANLALSLDYLGQFDMLNVDERANLFSKESVLWERFVQVHSYWGYGSGGYDELKGSVAECFKHWAQLYPTELQGRIYQREAAMWERTRGPKHFEVASSLLHLARTVPPEKRKPLLDRATTIFKEYFVSHGTMSSCSDDDMDECFKLKAQLGDSRYAKTVYTDQLDMCKRVYGPHSAAVSINLCKIAELSGLPQAERLAAATEAMSALEKISFKGMYWERLEQNSRDFLQLTPAADSEKALRRILALTKKFEPTPGKRTIHFFCDLAEQLGQKAMDSDPSGQKALRQGARALYARALDIWCPKGDVAAASTGLGDFEYAERALTGMTRLSDSPTAEKSYLKALDSCQEARVGVKRSTANLRHLLSTLASSKGLR